MNNKINVLYFSAMAPYDKVDHAGGKVHNFYIKEMQRTGKYDITLLSMCWNREVPLLDLNDYHIRNDIYVLDKNKAHELLRKGLSGFSYFNPFDKYGNYLLDYERYHYKKLVRKHYIKCKNGEISFPQLIIIQWTQVIFLIDYVKKYFPNVKIVAIEEDVSFLSFERHIDMAHGKLSRVIAKYRYHNMKKRELTVLNKADIVVNNNHKDLLLLEKEEIPKKKLRELPVFFKSYDYLKRKEPTNELLFYGAMARPENYKSAIWFIENVMPLLSDLDVRFVIVGARPDKSLLTYASDKVEITGFMDKVDPYFERCLCLVAPLVLGAGVKVKILEAMSSGIPVVTNHIGIEGIYAENGKHYIHCEAPEEYAECIHKLVNDYKKTAPSGRAFIRENYDLEKSFTEFMEKDLII